MDRQVGGRADGRVDGLDGIKRSSARRQYHSLANKCTSAPSSSNDDIQVVIKGKKLSMSRNVLRFR